MTLEKLKDFYSDLEDKWYGLIDRIDARVPVHGIVDRIDRVVPSFALFIVVIVLLGLALLLPMAMPTQAVFSFKVSDTDGSPVENAGVEVFLEGEQVFFDSTNEFGETGQAVLDFGATVTVVARKQGFQEFSETIRITKSIRPYSIVLTSLEETTYTVSLKDELGQPIRKPVTLSFACRNPDAVPLEDMVVFSGVATVTEPANCNGLIVSARGEGFELKDSVELVQSQQTIYLQEALGETATINVELYFGGEPIDEEIIVYIYKDNGTEAGLGPLESAASQNGTARFERQPAAYFVKSSGSSGFAAATSAVFSVSAGDVKTIRLELEQNIVGTIKISIVDGVTGGFVDNAKVLLRLGGQEIDSKVSSPDNDALVEFPVSQDTAYTVVIDHPGYCLKTVHDVVISSAIREIELTPFTDDCGGTLKVKVLDQDGRPVSYAVTGLYNEEGFNIGFATIVTDVNGIAEYSRVPSGDYKAFAFKASSSGWSDAEHFVQRAAEKTILTVVLIAGDGAIRANVSDDEGNPLQFASVAFIDALTLKAIGGGSMPVEDINGSVELVTRADKRVYIVASKPGYTNFTSTAVSVAAGTTKIIDAVLEKEIIQGEVEIVFKGMFKDGKRALKIAPGQQYDALFQLRVPANKNYDSIGMHVRTGKHRIMQLDKLALKKINAPGNVRIIKATSYSPSNGYAVDSQHLSSDEAKWANLQWPVFSTGLTQVSAKIMVKETANVGEQLNLFYRAWGEDDGSYKRDPADTELGEAESVPGKEGLYANAKQEIFQIGTETICDESFCFSGSILDLEEELVYNTTDSFSGKVFTPYKLAFTVLNNSLFETNSYLDAEIRLSNQDGGLLLQDYIIYGAQNQMREGIAGSDSTNWIEIGNLLPDNRAQGEINFTPQKSGLASLKIEIRSGQRIRFSKTISMSISSGKEMDVLITPSMLPSGIENTLALTVKDRTTGAEIESAIAKAADRFGTVVAERSTNKKGIALLKLPSLQPGEKLQLVIGKPDYETFEKTIEVNPAVAKVKPANIGVRLNAKTIFETRSPFSVENLTAFDLKIKGMQLNGKLYGLVDKEKVNNWLYAYVAETIRAGELKEMQLLSFLTEKGKKLEEPRQLEATLDILTEAFGSEWLTSVPVKISIGLGGEVDDPTCFTITRKEWKAGTEGVPIEIQFEAQNNCSISGAPVSLRNIGAKVEWATNQVGTFSVRTPENALDLRTGYAKKFAGVLMPEESIPIVLSFTPNGGINGKGVATIVFSAENPTESGAQLLTSKILAELTVVNLADCISFSKDVLLIKPEQSDSFEVETIGCGPRNEFRLESELTISHERFTLGEKASKEIEVLAEKNIAGQYPIRVYAKGSDEVQEKLIKTVRARILAGGCLELSRYEFAVFDNPENLYDGYDTAEIINHCYEKPVTAHVKFDEHDFGEAMKKGALIGLISGVIGGFMSEGNFWTGKKVTEEATKKVAGEAAAKAAAGGAAKTAVTSGGSSGGGGVLGAVGGWLSGIGSEIQGFLTGGGQPAGGAGTAGDRGPAVIDGTSPAGSASPAAITDWTADSTLYDAEQAAHGTGSFALGSGPTGMASLGSSGGLVGGILGGMVGGVGKSILGDASFLGWGLQGFVIGTTIAYMSQGEDEFSFTTIQRDLKYKDVELFMPGASLEEDKLVETPSTDIVVRDLEETSTLPSPVDPRTSIEKMKLGFLNVESVVQPDPATPFYRILKIDGERLEYKTEYDLKENKHPGIEVKERKQHKERFRLQFNAFDPMTVVTEPKPIPNCVLGTIVGVTGPSAVPRVAFDWSWSEIDEDSCDEGNPDYIYCDATQFSIEVLKKVQRLKDFIEANKPFSCPSATRSSAVKEQQLTGTAYDVGLTKLKANLVGEGDVNVVAVVESNNGQPMGAELRIDLVSGGSLVKSCTRQLELISKSIGSCQFAGIGNGEYQVRAVVVPELCSGCENNDLENDSIEAVLLIGSSGIAECEPYNTKRLGQFLEASNFSQAQIEEVQKLVNFNAYLIKDAYTNDFRADFDQFCKEKSFFDCPHYYLEGDGLHKFFADNDKFEFDYSMAPHAPIDAGKYSVTLNIGFGNQNWDFFSEGQPDAVIKVEMTELSAPEPDSPFYYLPFDGLIGIDSENGRQGYGINFRQTSQETIRINNSAEQGIVTTNIAGSTPISNGWIDAGSTDDFGVLNQVKRGILLDVRAGAEVTDIVLSPSYATPIVMRVDYEKGIDAYAFYSIEIDSSPQTAFTKMLPWSGIGVNCRDFADNPSLEAWQDTWDKHGGISGNLSCAVGTDITDFGIEWCSPKRDGSVFLQSVVFTPQNKNSLMKRTIYMDEMTLYNVEGGGGQIALNGVAGMPNNSYGVSGINSVEDVFDLVRENRVCLIGQGSRISNSFFWNTKTVLEEISSTRTMAEEECINSS